MSSFAVPIAIGITLPLCFKAMARLFPYQAPPTVSEEELARLRQRAQFIDLCLLPIFFLGVAGGTWLWALLLHALAERNLAELPPSRYLLKPEPYFIFWILPSLFLAIISVGMFLMVLMRLVLGQQGYRDYEMGAQARFNIHNRGWLWFLAGFMVFLVIAILLAQDWYTRFEEDRIAVNPLLSVGETRYTYQDVRRLVETSHLKAPNGTIVERQRWFIVFPDRRWCNEDLGSREGQEKREEEVRAFLRKKTGKPFEQVRFIEEIEK